eukprot:12400253-Karenia_brevis.AAC.1
MNDEKALQHYASMLNASQRARAMLNGDPDDFMEATEDLATETEELRVAADQAEAADATERRAAWKSWVQCALSAGAGAAHRWSKGPDPWLPQHAECEGGLSVAPSHILASEAK